MKAGHIIGCIGMALFLVSFFVPDRWSNISVLLSIGLLVCAAWFGSRKWLFAVGGIVLLTGTMFLLMMNRD
jgi:hypothetical protein